MDSGVFFDGSVIAAVIAGAIALVAPCCVSVMLPAYFTSAFPNRRLLVAMTFVFVAGVATIILPIALGAAVVQRVLVSEHTAVYTAVGVALVGLAALPASPGAARRPAQGPEPPAASRDRAGGRLLPTQTDGDFCQHASSVLTRLQAELALTDGRPLQLKLRKALAQRQAAVQHPGR